MTYRIINLPKTVKVGGHTYALEVTDNALMDELDRYGDCTAALRRIRVQEHMPEATHAIEVVMHEIMHACYGAYHIEAQREEEYTVRAIATALTSVLVENPDLRKWIEKTARL